MTPEIRNIVILGGTSAVAMAYARLQANAGHQICLVGRNEAALKANVIDLKARGAENASHHKIDLAKCDSIEKNWDLICKDMGTVDQLLLAYGILGDQNKTQENLQDLNLSLETNYLSAAIWAEAAFQTFRQQGHGQISVIGSVAGDRGRQSNYHYGSAKGGLDVLISGMAHRAARLREASVNVLLIKPGFIDTPMTDHIEKGGPLWASPEKIAKIIIAAEKKKKTKIYAPWFWRYILLIIRFVPFFVFKRTDL